MQLFIFKLKLALYLVGFLFNLVFGQAKKAKPLLLIIFFLFIVFGLVFFYFVRNNISSAEEEVVETPTYSPTRPDLYIKSEKTEAKIQEEILFWEKIIEKQPNSRDALINLATLKRSLNQNEEADKLWDKAKATDPTNPIFID